MRTGINWNWLKVLLILVLITLLIPSSPIMGVNEHSKTTHSELAPEQYNIEILSISGDSDSLKNEITPDSQKLNEDNVDQPLYLNQQVQTLKQEQAQLKAQARSNQFPADHPMNDYSDVLLVVNDNSTISKQIADYFRTVRNIPDINICNITAQTAEQVTRAEFNRIRSRIESYIQDNELEDEINYIITTKGLPIRISSGNWRLRASVDSELCLILGPYATWIDDSTNYQVSHVYYQAEKHFTHKEFPIYLVTRLTGYNFSDVKTLIDNAAASANQRNGGGSFLFDRDMSSNKATNPWRGGNDRMMTAHNDLLGKGYTSTVESSGTFLTERNNLAGYCSWGTSDNYYYTSPLQNRGLDLPNNEAVTTPTGWTFNYFPFVEDITRNATINRTARFSVNISRPVNNTGFTYISQNVTIKAGIRYFLSGYVKRVDVANYNGGGAILQIKAYDSTNTLVWMMNSTPRYGGPDTGFVTLYQIPYEPIPGVTKLQISAGIAKSRGTAFFDDIALWEIRPKNTYVPGAIAEIYGHSTAYTLTNPHWFYRLTVGDLIMDGITGIKGYVDYADPYITTNTRVDLLFDRYTAGYTLAESFYAASPYMSWVDMVIGDPKCAPYFNIFPDATLSVENITFSNENANEGEHVDIQARIENHGGSSLGNLKVHYFVGEDLDTAVEVGTDNVASVSSMGSSISIVDWNTTKFNGTLTVWVYADYLDEFYEQNETNNLQSKQIMINSYPSIINLKVSQQEIYRGEKTGIFINITDFETLENELNCSIYYNSSKLNAWKLLPNLKYKSDHWQTSFITNAATITGWYDIKIIITDENNASVELVKPRFIRVLNNPPVVNILEVTPTQINRTENITIYFTASDFETTLTLDFLMVYYRESGTSSSWIAAMGEQYTKLGTGDNWQYILTSTKTMKPVTYDLKIIVIDADSDTNEEEKFAAFQVRNNAPVIDGIEIKPISIYRRDFATIYINGGDIETPRTDMTVELEYKPSSEGATWIKLTKPAPRDTHWEGVFYTNTTTIIGNYTFRARLKDKDGVWTDFISPENEVKVINNPPEAVNNLGTDVYQTNEDEKIWFDATNSTDIEDNICSEFFWDFGDGTTNNESKNYHSFTRMGEYIVTLTVYDKDFGSNSSTTKIEILNVKPTAVTKVDRISAKVIEPIQFNGTGSSDTKSDLANLTYLWDFDDNTTSNEPSVTHVFITPGTFSVSLTVMDDDGANDTTTMYISIEPQVKKDDGDEEKDNFFYILGEVGGIPILVIILIIVIILLLIIGMVFIIKRSKQVARLEELEPEEPIETVEADIVEAPEVGLGKSMKPKKARGAAPAVTTEGEEPIEQSVTITEGLGITPEKVSKIQKLEGGEEGISDVEVEFVPDLPKHKTAPTKGVDTEEEGIDITEEPVVLPGAEEEIKYPLPATIDSEPAEDAIEFVPPKIDLPISEEMVDHEPSPEVEEAMKRGEGLSLDFKRPEKKKR